MVYEGSKRVLGLLLAMVATWALTPLALLKEGSFLLLGLLFTTLAAAACLYAFPRVWRPMGKRREFEFLLPGQ